MMEEKIFPRPAVAEELSKKFIEARLHTDGGSRQQANVELQEKLTGSRANPIYVILEPASGRILRREDGAMRESKFLEFLRGAALE